jgi:hypothetical protein
MARQNVYCPQCKACRYWSKDSDFDPETKDFKNFWACDNCNYKKPIIKRKRKLIDTEWGQMTAAQERAIKRMLKDCVEHDTRMDGGHIKHFEVTNHGAFVCVVMETGRENDENTLASVFCRVRRQVFIRKGGGISIVDRSSKEFKTRSGWFHVINHYQH